MPQIQHKEDICYWHLRTRTERIIAGIVLLFPCSLMALYGYMNMNYSSNYILLQIIGWAGIATYILQFLIVEGMEFSQRQIYFFRGPLILGLFWHSERASMEREKEISFQHKSKQDLGQSFYSIEVKGMQNIHKIHWSFAMSFANRDSVRKMISILQKHIKKSTP